LQLTRRRVFRGGGQSHPLLYAEYHCSANFREAEPFVQSPRHSVVPRNPERDGSDCARPQVTSRDCPKQGAPMTLVSMSGDDKQLIDLTNFTTKFVRPERNQQRVARYLAIDIENNGPAATGVVTEGR